MKINNLCSTCRWQHFSWNVEIVFCHWHIVCTERKFQFHYYVEIVFVRTFAVCVQFHFSGKRNCAPILYHRKCVYTKIWQATSMSVRFQQVSLKFKFWCSASYLKYLTVAAVILKIADIVSQTVILECRTQSRQQFYHFSLHQTNQISYLRPQWSCYGDFFL